MSHVSLLLLFGPCLMMAMAAVAAFCTWLSLSRVPHALLWGAAFLLDTLRWGVLAMTTDDAGAVPPGWSLPLQLLPIATVLLLVGGFRTRAGQAALPLPVLAGFGIIAAALCLLPAAALPPGIGAALVGGVTAGAFLYAAGRAAGGERRGSLAGSIAVAMLLVQGVGSAAIGAIAIAQATGRAPPLPPQAMLVYAVGPWSAATGLVAMFLIASDLWLDLNRLAHTDPLTGVLNRLGFEVQARRAIRRMRFPRRPLVVAIGDIDRFKAINDAHGHLAGDAALACFAGHAVGRLDNCVVGRIGGEEFAFVLPAHDAAAAFGRVEELRTGLADLSFEDRPALRLTASFGLAELLRGEALPEVMARADRALYAAKEGGRDRTCRHGEVAMLQPG